MQKKTKQYKERKPTQGHKKMLLYLEDLIRNENFRFAIKKLRRSYKLRNEPSGTYNEWTPEQKKRSDEIGKELSSLLEGYEMLRKRCKRLIRDKYFIHEEEIASNYGLNFYQIQLAQALLEDDEQAIQLWSSIDNPIDVCVLLDNFADQLSPYNKGEEIIYLNPTRQLQLAAYPIAIGINPLASKRDVLDYVEKRWEWIDALRSQYREKVLRIRKRKLSQKLVDFIWENRSLPAKKIKAKLDVKFPANGLVYYEISKIISLERERRGKYI